MEDNTGEQVESATKTAEEDVVIEPQYSHKHNMGATAEVPAPETVETVESENSKKTSTNPSDYDSADSYSDAENEDAREHSGSESEGSIQLKREEGDGQESLPPRKIDDDEDKKNPQYIPKRGTFYEHDDRTAEDNEEETQEEKEKAEKEGKKKIWTDKKEKWNHDKFNDDDQAPKSRAELVSIYGYDIRNEEGPPRARRRRRYGRGPNKYTRNWEDEDAYNKPPAAVTKRLPIRKSNKNLSEDKPEGNSIEEGNYSGRQSSEGYNDRTSSSEQSSQSNSLKSREFAQPPPKPAANNSNAERQNNNKNQRAGSGRVAKPSREIRDSDYRGFTKPRQFAAKAPKDGPPPPKEQPPHQNNSNKRNYDIEKEMGKLNVHEQQNYTNKGAGGPKHNNNRQSSVPPRMQAEQKGSKRYSSIRQRSLPEPSAPTFNQQHGYYGNAEYNQQNQPNVAQQQPPPQQPLLHPPAQILPNPPPMAAIPPPPLTTIPQVPVTTTQLPPQFGTPFPQPPPAFLQAAPPPFIPQPTPNIINYVQGQPQFAPPQPPYQGYQPPFNPVTQPTEIFQPPGGITYYSPQEQQIAQRAAPQKRPKAAIPIVPPPPLEPRGRGRSANLEAAPNSTGEVVESKIEGNYEDFVVQQQ